MRRWLAEAGRKCKLGRGVIGFLYFTRGVPTGGSFLRWQEVVQGAQSSMEGKVMADATLPQHLPAMVRGEVATVPSTPPQGPSLPCHLNPH